MSSIGEKVWNAEYAGPDGALAQHEALWKHLSKEGRRKKLVSRASIYYSAATNALKRASKGNIFALVLGLRRLRIARAASYSAFERDNLNADELDVIQSVFRATSIMPWWRRDLDRAAGALTRAHALPMEDHTRTFLQLGHIDLALRSGAEHQEVLRLYRSAEEAYLVVRNTLQAAGIFKLVGPTDELQSEHIQQLGRQASRITRHLSAFASKLGLREEAEEYGQSALMFAQVFQSKDQAIKVS